MAGYTKLFNSILASTIWRADNDTRIVWITMLAMANKRGIVEASIPGLADFARVPIDACQRALANLLSPDEFSRTKDHDGRRIKAIDGGWQLLNHGKYRDTLSAEERREYKRIKQREYRSRTHTEPVDNTVDTNSTSGRGGHIQHQKQKQHQHQKQLQKQSLDLKEQANSGEQAAKGGAGGSQHTPGNGSMNARSKRPVFTGSRFVVFDWQLEDLTRLLGSHTDAFDLHEWFFTLDERCRMSGEVIPQRDGGRWLQDQTLAEARRRNLPIAIAMDTKTSTTLDGLTRFAQRRAQA